VKRTHNLIDPLFIRQFLFRLISNTFTIDSAGISPATRQHQQQMRGAQRRRNIIPQNINFDIKCDSPMKANMDGEEEDISFYSSNSQIGSASPHHCHNDDIGCLSPGTSPSIFTIENNAMHSNSLESMSIQSDIGNSSSNRTTSSFTFLKPKSPENSSPTSLHRTPSKYTMSSGGSSRMGNGFKVFHSLSSGSNESIDPDDEYMELMEMENMDEDAQMPTDLSSLFSKDIKNSRTPEMKRSSSYVRKCLNMDTATNLFNSPSTPKSSTITSLITTPERQCLATINDNIMPFASIRNPSTGAFKRPEPPTVSPIQSKRYKCENSTKSQPILMPVTQQQSPQPQQPKRPILRKSVSMNDAAIIMNALSRSTEEKNLIGDFSKQFCLPLIDGRHTDLKSISAETMRRLLLGEFDESVASYKVIDCRYPYEFEGGHIQGALNLFTQEQVLDELVSKKTDIPIVAADGQKRNILIFHCEFSSERGPRL
jgi:M-phase inducer phosphatase 2